MPRSRLQVARPPINMSAGNTTAWHTAPRRAAPRRAVPRPVPRHSHAEESRHTTLCTAPHLPIPLRHFVPASPLFPAHSFTFSSLLISSFPFSQPFSLSSFLPSFPSTGPLSFSLSTNLFSSAGAASTFFILQRLRSRAFIHLNIMEMSTLLWTRNRIAAAIRPVVPREAAGRKERTEENRPCRTEFGLEMEGGGPPSSPLSSKPSSPTNIYYRRHAATICRRIYHIP